MDPKIESVKYEDKINSNSQWPQWLAVLSASLNFFTAGICFGWSSPSLVILQSGSSPFLVNNNEASWIAAFLPIGCAVGPIVGSYLSRFLGPKQTTTLSSIPYIVGFLLIIFANGPTLLYLSRFLSGFAVGLGQTATPIYISEIAENRNRGALLSFFTFSMGIGAMFVCFIGPFISITVMAEISLIFPTLLFLTMLFMPESPYYLYRVNRKKEAEKSIKWLRRQSDRAVIKDELDVIKESASENLSLFEGCKQLVRKPNPKALGIVNLLFIGQNICGAIVVTFYQEQIYEATKVPIPAEVAVMISAVIGNSAGFLSVIFIDRWGRRPLVLISAIGCAISTGILGTYMYLCEKNVLENVLYMNWTPVVAINVLQISFAFGLGPVPYTQLGEMFSSNVKEIAICLISVISGIEGVLMTKFFQVIQDSYGITNVFWGLSILTLITFFLILQIVPETKAKSFTDIQNMLRSNKKETVEAIKLQTISTRF